jgi:hypothetical protein
MTASKSPDSLRLEKRADHLRLVLIHLAGVSIVIFVFYLTRFRPVEQNPWALFAGLAVLMLGSLCWCLINYQKNSTANVATLNARVATGTAILVIANIALVPFVQFRLMQSVGNPLPWVFVSKGFANEFAYTMLAISAISFNRYIVHAVATFVLIGQGFLALMAWTSDGVRLGRSAYAGHMSDVFDPGSSFSQMLMTSVIYVAILAVIRVHVGLLNRIHYVAPKGRD